MATYPFTWLTENNLTVATEKLQAAFEACGQQWFSEQTIRIECSIYSASATQGNAAYWRQQDGLWFVCSPDKELLSGLYSFHQDSYKDGASDHPTIRVLLQRLVEDFSLALANTTNSGSRHIERCEVELPEWFSAHASGALSVTVSVADTQWRWVLSPQSVRSLLNMQMQKSNKPMVKRSSALGQGSIPLSVNLGKAALSWNEFTQLQVGDVVKLDNAADQAFELVTSDNDLPVAHAYLAKRGEHFAVVVKKS